VQFLQGLLPPLVFRIVISASAFFSISIGRARACSFCAIPF
jgi:hypothetical protein